MIQLRTMLKSADNSGAKKLQCIRVQGASHQRYASIGEIVKVVIKEATPHSAVKKSEVHDAVVVRTRKELRRTDGSYIRFDDNAVVLVNVKDKEPKATRIFGPIPRELRNLGYAKIVSLAPEVL